MEKFSFFLLGNWTLGKNQRPFFSSPGGAKDLDHGKAIIKTLP
jgi:hypothetical protein